MHSGGFCSALRHLRPPNGVKLGDTLCDTSTRKDRERLLGPLRRWVRGLTQAGVEESVT